MPKIVRRPLVRAGRWAFQLRGIRATLRLMARALLVAQGMHSRRPLWLIACGGDRWGDNAEALWRHLVREHPEVRAIAVLKRKPDVAMPEGSWVRRGSLLNGAMALLADVLATTHSAYDLGPRPLIWASPARKIWLKHGVTGIKRHQPEREKWVDFDVVCATSRREARLLAASRGLRREVVHVTGFARHDRLVSLAKGSEGQGILFAPTFRQEPALDDLRALERDLFSWIPLVTADEALPVGDRRVSVWMHPTWRTLGLGSFGVEGGARLVDLQDIQGLLASSRVVVTDYSSVAFDAAITGIPVVFFQPDRETYMRARGLFFSFARNRNLLVVKRPEELARVLRRLLTDRAFQRSRVDRDSAWARRYIETFDGRSCERIVDTVIQRPMENSRTGSTASGSLRGSFSWT